VVLVANGMIRDAGAVRAPVVSQRGAEQQGTKIADALA
jgi:hypothetical protein